MDLKTLQKICFSLFLMTFMVFGAFAANPTQTYDDVTPNDWFYDTVMDLTKEGVVNGVGNNRFAPNRSVTTNEFVLMLLRMDTSSNGTTANLYNQSPLLYANQKGLLTSTITWDKPLTRAEMAHIALAATSITPWEQAECPVAFVDMDAIPVEYQDDVNGVAALGLMTGTGTNQFAPQKEVTRAEACTVLCRLHQMGNIDTNALAPSEIQNMKIVFESKAVEENSYPYRKVLAKLPVELLELFTDKGWTLVFVADTATRYPQYSDAIGVTDAARRQICIEVESSLFLSDVQTVAHEFGHFLKYCTGSAINSKNNVAYQAEKDDLAALVHSNYCKQDPDEFFAEAFMASICYSSTAMEKAPQAYDVVMLALDTVFGDEM